MRSFQDHLTDPSLGEPPAAALAGESPNTVDGCAGGSCGVLAQYWITVNDQGIIEECSARIRGRAAAFATASALCEAATGLSVVAAGKLGVNTLHPSFQNLTSEELERALVAEDGFHHAIGRWLLERMREAPEGVGPDRPTLESIMPSGDRPRVIVGMSGGVDSAVSLHRMQEEFGGKAVGATLRLWIDPTAPDPESACCSPDSVRRARHTCHRAGLPHISIDLRESFAREIVVPFVSDYAKGETPNPCIRCNGHFRLDELVRLADVVGADYVATGHYARTISRNGVTLIGRGVDASKDQSYMLAQVMPETAKRLRFPLGEQHKTEIRVEASELGLEQAEAPDSQEVCFLGGGDYRKFLKRAGALGAPGDIVLAAEDSPDGAEKVVGKHDGIARFTPGQRRGIGVAAERPLYVLDVDAETGRVLVGTNADGLEKIRVPLSELEWHDPAKPNEVNVQLRYRARFGGVFARVSEGQSDNGVAAWLELSSSQRAPAPGQAAVLYDLDGFVVGVGKIMRDKP